MRSGTKGRRFESSQARHSSASEPDLTFESGAHERFQPLRRLLDGL
jgi:hypothetical protein